MILLKCINIGDTLSWYNPARLFFATNNKQKVVNRMWPDFEVIMDPLYTDKFTIIDKKNVSTDYEISFTANKAPNNPLFGINVNNNGKILIKHGKTLQECTFLGKKYKVDDICDITSNDINKNRDGQTIKFYEFGGIVRFIKILSIFVGGIAGVIIVVKIIRKKIQDKKIKAMHDANLANNKIIVS